MKKTTVNGQISYSIKTKLIIISCMLLVLPLLLTGIISYRMAKKALNEEGEVVLKNSVRQAIQLIEAKHQQVLSGDLTLSEAQEQVKVYLLGPKDSEGKRPINKNIDLGENGYFIVYDETGLEVAHPTLEGTNVWDVEDKSGNGVKLVQEQIRIAQSGGGFLTYAWNLPNSEEIGEKISYQEYEPNWGWIVTAGTYMSDFNQGSASLFRVILMVSAVAIALGIVVIILFTNHVTQPIRTITHALEEVAQGNFALEEIAVKNRDETDVLAKAFNEMLRNTKGLVAAAKESTNNLRTFADSLTAITEESTKAVQEVTMAVQEVANAVGEEAKGTETAVQHLDTLSQNIDRMVDSSIQMNDIINITSDASNKGLFMVDILTRAKEESNEATEEIGEAIQKVAESTSQIHVITETITQISQQTNLLALNASIEAARAGELGRGFAVVAEEIRKLAEGSASAINEIKEILGSINEYSQTSVKTMEQVKQVSQEQSEAVDNTKVVFEEIANAISSLISVAGSIDKESAAMKQRKDEIVGIMTDISASTQQTSAATEEVSASSEEQLASLESVFSHIGQLTEMVAKMQRILDQFRVN